jgi:TolB-like protein/Tfp pilus assembly protein PilF
MGNLFAELKRRHIYRVAAAYAVVAWVLLQLAANVSPILDLPPWIARTVLLLLVIGFPVALVFAWVHQLGPESGALARASTGKLDWALMGALVVVIALVSYEQLAPSFSAKTAQQANGAAARQASLSLSGAISIAVLPFVNLSSDKEQEFFSDGMTEEITSALAKIASLNVVARTSSFQFKGQNTDVRAIGQSLGATHLIEGSVRKAGIQVRITAQLIRTDTGAHLWTESYDRELKDVFATQEDIAQAIAGALQVPLGLKQGENLVSSRTNDFESYDSYLRARGLYRAREIGEAVKLLEPAVVRDPGFAPAWALLAHSYNLLPNYSEVLRQDSIPEARRAIQSLNTKAETAAREAIRLDPRYAGGYSALADMRTLRGNWKEAEDLYRQALALDPANPETLSRYEVFLIDTGRLKEALAVGERLRILEPFVPVYSSNAGLFMQLNGQDEASIALLQATPGAALVRNTALARAYAAAGRNAEAAATLLAINDNRLSRRSVEVAAGLLSATPRNANSPVALPFLEGELGLVYPFIGALDRVLEFPERGAEINFLGTVTLSPLWFPSHAPLRKTERFKALVRKIGLVEYWRAKGWPDLCHPTGADDFTCE